MAKKTRPDTDTDLKIKAVKGYRDSGFIKY